jgi:imidazole glycerol-phosphate synthase subunit HisH
MKKITIIDYGCSNILNLARALKFLGYNVDTTNNKKKIINSSHVILPGVGAFSSAIKQLEKLDLRKTILEYAKSNRPLLGICLGMQLLFDESYEFGIHNGLGLIEGKVEKIKNEDSKNIKIPHVGWNEVYLYKNKTSLENKVFTNTLEGKNFYFVHSFACTTKNPNFTIAACDYLGVPIPAIVSKGNIYGCQFHPEKSAENGLLIIKNFCKI